MNYEDISMGFELETQQLCFVTVAPGSRVKRILLRLPTEHTKHSFFQNSVEVYNDTFTPRSAFATSVVGPYLQSLQGRPSGQHHTLLTSECVLEGHDFNNNEFVVTFPRKQSVAKDALWSTLLVHFLKAVDKVVDSLKHYTVVPIEDPRFPYRSLLVSKDRDPRYSKVAFLAQKSPKDFVVQNLSFHYQCTIGFRLENAMSVLGTLAAQYYETKEGVENTVPSLVHEAETLHASPLLKNYLFLFLYSATTRHVRKLGSVFILRHAFQDLKVLLSEEDTDRLDTWYREHRLAVNAGAQGVANAGAQGVANAGAQEDYNYFRAVHFDPAPTTQQQKYTRQGVWDVGRLPFRKNEGRVFVEFRGLQGLLNHYVGGQRGPKSIKDVRLGVEKELMG
jgi:hypothetical protein